MHLTRVILISRNGITKFQIEKFQLFVLKKMFFRVYSKRESYNLMTKICYPSLLSIRDCCNLITAILPPIQFNIYLSEKLFRSRLSDIYMYESRIMQSLLNIYILLNNKDI